MIKVYGASDDLIEVEGEITEEFGSDHGFLIFSDGTMLEVNYTHQGIWRITILRAGRNSEIRYEHVATDGETSDYSDIVVVDSGYSFQFVALLRNAEDVAWRSK